MKKQFFILLMLLVVSVRLFAAGGDPVTELILRVRADVEDLNKVYIFRDSPEYYTRLRTYYNNTLQQLNSIPFKPLDVSAQVDYILLKRNIEEELKKISDDEKVYNSLLPVIPFAAPIMTMQEQRRRGDKADAPQIAATLATVQAAIVKARAALQQKNTLTAPMAHKAADVVDELRNGLKNVYDFYYGYDPSFTWWVKQPYQRTDSMLEHYADYLGHEIADKADKTLDASGIKGTPIGKEALIEQLQFQMIPYNPEELVAMANKEFAWCDAEMLKASRALGCGDDWKKALEKVKENHVTPGQQPALIHQLADEAVKFVEDNNLVTVPALAKEAWRMYMLTMEQQRFAPFFLGGESILVAYPTDAMDENTKVMSMRSNNYAFAHATVFHELIPGHNLQGFMNKRNKPYRSMFGTPFSVEGWALYWEMLLWDKNFHSTPEQKVGALFWRMHRCARIIFSLNYHLGKWTPQQCIDFLVDRVGHERFSAESEVRRSFEGNYGPLYQIAYMMGGLQLRALHHELIDSKKMTELQFHDAFLHENAIPVEMFRAIITQQSLAPDFKTQWRFADQLLQ
ncbi:uncharacterized protein (DUF885 family) [Chitinophaga niastensis]|uniref:Uncharacterized protein (DUF885 family) n=1 Tax=Chitinophaga niastensis TaxID=536980 RepID=A0A2P8HNK6_CHINA|nr:DUF885 family protein [Chitinophaga niastensis]PSL47792.1 uncharacterized protein (DUF885 family) [Chitinophaga niastensis]